MNMCANAQVEKSLNRYQKDRVEKTVKAIIKAADEDKNGLIDW